MTKSETKFTPGPWSLDDTRYRTGHEVRQNVLDANGGVVLAVPADRTFAAYEANAHLISAAPELYEAANAAFDFLGGIDGAANVRGQLLAAIAKARGNHD